MPGLLLKYAFIPTPFPIRASAKGANPNQIALQVMIDNPGSAVIIDHIDIQIPMGSAGGNVLAVKTAPPAPDYSSKDWVITLGNPPGDTLTIKPNPGASGTVSSTIIFSLKGIDVNENAGIVPITITEYYSTKPKAIDGVTYSLAKLETDFWVTNFYADNPVLFNLKQKTKIHWNCSDAGKGLDYALRTGDSAAVPYRWQDGIDGVETKELTATTVFALDIKSPVSSGSSAVLKTLFLTVRVEVPKFDDDSFVEKYLSGRIISLHWLALNASKCEVRIDGEAVDANGGVDTYRDGYFVGIPSKPDKYTPSVRAYARSGAATDTETFEPVRIQPFVPITTNLTVRSMAITPDGKNVLTTDQSIAMGFTHGGDWNVNVINLASGRISTITGGDNPTAIAIKPDGSLALVANHHFVKVRKSVFVPMDCDLSVIDLPVGADNIPNGAARATIPIGTNPSDIAITPNGQLALVSDYVEGVVRVVNLNSLLVQTTINSVGSGATAMAITPNGKLALVTTEEGKITVINLDTLAVESNAIATPGDTPYDIAITPDSKLALIINHFSCTVIDIINRRVQSPPIPVGGSPIGVAITPDGKLGILASFSGNSLTVIKMADPQAKPFTIPFDGESTFVESVTISERANKVIVGASWKLIPLTLLDV